MTILEPFNDSLWWHEHLHFVNGYIIKEDFTRDNKGRVISIDYVVLDSKGRFITLETTKTLEEVKNICQNM